MSIRLYVGNLPEDVDRQALETAFAEAGNAVSIKLITDRKTNQCRGFGFVTVKTDEEADQFIAQFNGKEVNEITLKIEKALPREKTEEAPVAKAKGSAKVKGGRTPQAAKAAHVDIAAFQPDPRWASALEQLKDRLAETANSIEFLS
ncbi:MAG: RNA-binding protein [Alkalinema sp. RL_2_19]|nr:RNA-binding protein [Alkalinema sp. RL_2_19]